MVVMTAEIAMPDFWLSSGFHLLARDGAGRLRVTDDYLRAYFARPEVRPVAESCANEIGLNEALLRDPRLPVTAARIGAMADPDAQESYRHVLAFRDHLLAHPTIEEAYLTLFRGGVRVPPLFLEQLAHVILRNVLDGCGDPFRVRAAEILFRSQRLTQRDGAIMLADEDTVEMYAQTGGFGSLGQLLQQVDTPTRTVALDVLTETNAALYWDRSDTFDTVLDISFTRPGLDAFCRVLEGWVAHMLGVVATVQPVQRISDERWIWHVGLDADANAILNDLYNGIEVDEPRLARLVSLFRMEFADASLMRPGIAGRPIYLGMAIDAGSTLRVKPQNLLFNLPLADSS
jgi:Family of unknown function (DUF6352)